MQLEIRSEDYLDYIRHIHHWSGSPEIKNMLYQALSHFDKEYLETNLYQWKHDLSVE